jgi:hypothetical protein
MTRTMVAALAFNLFMAAVGTGVAPQGAAATTYRGLQKRKDFIVVEEIPHDRAAFT